MINEKILDGRLIAGRIYEKISATIKTKHLQPKLSIIQVGNNSASNIYVNKKLRIAKELGISANLYKFDIDAKKDEIIDRIERCNQEYSGTIVQLPLPNHLDSSEIINNIHPDLDVDGLTIVNQGLLFNGHPNICPCTPLGVVTLLKNYNIDILGKHVVIVGRSNLVGKPLMQMMLHEDATVTLCHSKTNNLKDITSSADILISATGCAKFIKRDFVKENAIVVDIGISYVNNKISGDVDFDDVFQKVSKITPVPGGVGPMTVAMLMYNTMKVAENFV